MLVLNGHGFLLTGHTEREFILTGTTHNMDTTIEASGSDHHPRIGRQRFLIDLTQTGGFQDTGKERDLVVIG